MIAKTRRFRSRKGPTPPPLCRQRQQPSTTVQLQCSTAKNNNFLQMRACTGQLPLRQEGRQTGMQAGRRAGRQAGRQAGRRAMRLACRALAYAGRQCVVYVYVCPHLPAICTWNTWYRQYTTAALVVRSRTRLTQETLALWARPRTT